MADDDVLRAVRKTLADYLRTTLATSFPSGLTVSEEWPDEHAKLPRFAVSVLVHGEPQYWFHPPAVISTTPDADPAPTGVVLYQYGYADQIMLSLDCWAATKPDRDALARALRRALNRPPTATVTGVTPNFLRLGRDPGLSLTVADLYNVVAVYHFTPVEVPGESEQAAETNEYRAHFDGNAEVALVEQEDFPLIKRLSLGFKINGGPTETVGVNPAATIPEGMVSYAFRRTVRQPADGTDFRVTLPLTFSDANYVITVGGSGNDASPFYEIRFPFQLTSDRTGTYFRVLTSGPIPDGDVLEFIVQHL